MLSLEAKLRNGCDALGIRLSEMTINGLLNYLELICKWNKVYNLTAIREPEEMLTLHLLDSLSAISPLRRQIASLFSGHSEVIRCLDVGSGAGLPGVVIALCCPELGVDCVDAVGKKAAFIQQAAANLRLPNLRGLHARVESLRGPYQIICSRAFASLGDFTGLTKGSLAGDGIWMAMKGRQPDDELSNLSPDVQLFHVEPLVVPGLDAERCIVWMRHTDSVIAVAGKAI